MNKTTAMRSAAIFAAVLALVAGMALDNPIFCIVLTVSFIVLIVGSFFAKPAGNALVPRDPITENDQARVDNYDKLTKTAEMLSQVIQSTASIASSTDPACLATLAKPAYAESLLNTIAEAEAALK